MCVNQRKVLKNTRFRWFAHIFCCFQLIVYCERWGRLFFKLASAPGARFVLTQHIIWLISHKMLAIGVWANIVLSEFFGSTVSLLDTFVGICRCEAVDHQSQSDYGHNDVNSEDYIAPVHRLGNSSYCPTAYCENR